MRYAQLIENREYNLARKAQADLSYEARRALNSWEWSNWDSGDLSTHFETNSQVAQEIEQSFMPIRKLMKNNYGATIKLYRGIVAGEGREPRSDRKLFSWTSSSKIAKAFAGKNIGHKKYSLLSDSDVKAAIDRYQAKGFTSIYNKKYIVNKEQPKYYNIYDRYNNFITDGDNIQDEINYAHQQRIQANNDLDSFRGTVFEKDIPIDDIVWILMGGNANEYIVKGHSQ